MTLGGIVGDGVHEVCLTQTYTAIEKKRVVAGTGFFGHRSRPGMRKPVTCSHYESVKGVARMQ